MKTQRFGIEIEMTGITRSAAADVVAAYLGGTKTYEGGSYDAYTVTDSQGRKWKLMRDASIQCYQKNRNRLEAADSAYSVELVSPILCYNDISDLQEIIRRLRHAGALSDSRYACGIHIHLDAEKHTPQTLRNLVNLMASKEDLIYKSLQIDPRRMRFCKRVNERLLEAINKKKPKTIAQLKDIWYADYDNFQNRERHYHDSRYHGLNLHSTFTKGTIEFRLFNGTTHAGKIRSYLVFCLAVSHQALIQKCASAKRTYTDNEKYTFRCWLLRLGLIGDEYKNCREHLMASLNGDAAWRNGRAA